MFILERFQMKFIIINMALAFFVLKESSSILQIQNIE